LEVTPVEVRQTDAPLVTVIMAAYNTEPYIGEAIESILAQTYTNFELIIVDDASKDGTLSVIQRYQDPRITVLKNEKNLMILKTRKRAFDIAKGKYFTLLDSDDTSAPNRLELQVKALEEDPNLGGVGTMGYYMSPEGQVLQPIQRALSTEEIREKQMVHNQFISASLMYRTALVRELGLYRSYFEIGAEDIDLQFRVCYRNPIRNLPEQLYHVRLSPNSFSRSLITLDRYLVSNLVIELYKQRLATGTDALDTGDKASFNEIINRLKGPYLQDPSRLAREMVAKRVLEGRTQDALSLAAQAIRQNPRKIINYRTWFYVWRKIQFQGK
jgi:glycosyltransferase involved in cell wall biosynthesis